MSSTKSGFSCIHTFIFLISLLLLACQGLLNASTLNPATPSVAAGSSVTITSSAPVSWRLVGTGSLSNQSSTSVTYNAPSQVHPRNAVLGCPAGPNDTIFNTPVDNLPVNPHSAAWMAAAAASWTLSTEWDNWGVSYADNSTGTQWLKTYYGQTIYPNFVIPAQGPKMQRQGGDYQGTFGTLGSPDHHIMTVRRTDCSFYESYDNYINGFTRACQDGSAGCNVQSAITYKSMDYAGSSAAGTNAASLPLAPVSWRLDEIKSGEIEHAGFFTTNLGGVIAGAYVWPALGTAGGCSLSSCPNAMPMGTRMRLNPTFNIASVCNSGNVQQDGYCTTIMTAMKKYGFYLGDTGSTNSLEFLQDVSQDNDVMAAIRAIGAAAISMNNLQAVDESSLEVSATSYQVCPYRSSCMSGTNSYVQPQDQAVLIATLGDGSSISTPIGIQGVSIGLGIPAELPVTAGSYQFQIPFWVNGTPNQSVNWSVQSGVGSVSEAGVYTPPAYVGTPVPTVLIGTSAEDSSAVARIFLNVIPSAEDNAATVRIDSGATTPNTDAAGHVWQADVGIDGGASDNTGDYPHWDKNNVAQDVIYESDRYSGSDVGNTIVVPNGNYKIHLLFGKTSDAYCDVSCSSFIVNTPWDQYSWGPYMLEAQGIIQNHYYNYGAHVGFMFQAPTDAYIPARVTNNLLQVYVRGLSNDIAPHLTPTSTDINKYVQLNGLEVIPDSTPAHWTIDTQAQNSINPGQTLNPFYVVDWFTGRNDANWSIVSGPNGASINAFGILSLASSATPNGQPIVVQASDGAYTATATIATGNTATPPVPPSSPTPGGFAYSRTLTINHALVSNTDQSNFPVEISITDGSLATAANGGHVQNNSGYDIIFASNSSGSSLLKWDVESYNAATGTWIGHVLIPTLSHTQDTVIYMLYGKSGVTSSQANAAAVWQNGYQGVYHFASSRNLLLDSTGNNYDGQSYGLSSDASGAIGKALGTTGGAGTLPQNVMTSSSGSIEMWVNMATPENTSNNAYLVAQNWGDDENQFHMGWSAYDNAFEAVWYFQGNTTRVAASFDWMPIQPNNWNHIVYTWDRSSGFQILYLNGNPVGVNIQPFGTPSFNTSLSLSIPSNPAYYGLQGAMDEARFSNTVRTVDWIKTEYQNQLQPGNFVNLGSENSN